MRTRELSALQSSHQAPLRQSSTRGPGQITLRNARRSRLVRSTRAELDGLKIVGVSPAANILRSWVEASIALPLQVTQIYPEDWHVRDIASPNFTATTSLDALFEADVIITDCWPDGAPAGSTSRIPAVGIAARQMPPRRDFPALPARHPGPGGQRRCADAPACQSPSAKAYLLHAQNALLGWIAA